MFVGRNIDIYFKLYAHIFHLVWCSYFTSDNMRSGRVSDLHRAKGHDENSDLLTFSQCSRIIRVALLWDPPEAGFEARMQVHVVYLGSSSRDHKSGNGKQIGTRKNQSSKVPLWKRERHPAEGIREAPWILCLSVIPTERREDHSFNLISHWMTAAGGMPIPSSLLAYGLERAPVTTQCPQQRFTGFGN